MTTMGPLPQTGASLSSSQVRNQALLEIVGHKVTILHGPSRWDWTHAYCFCGFTAETHPAIDDWWIEHWHDEEAG